MTAQLRHNKQLFLYAVAVLLLAAFTYFYNYQNPAAVFWDENYHIASAQKYLAGVMYMEPHPPLGKLFIALGEWLLNPNAGLDLAYFTQTDYIKKFPEGYSFAGVRLFPTLFATAASVLFFLILYRLCKEMEYAFLFTALYLFENAFILHSRSAMLESAQIFFIFATILYFLRMFDQKKSTAKEYGILGLLIGLVFMVKANGLILVLLFPFLFFYQMRREKGAVAIAKELFVKGTSTVLGMMVVITAVFYLHFSLGEKLGAKNYKASAQYMNVIKEGSVADPRYFMTMLKDNFAYMQNYSKGVPRYDPCKKGENGSLTATWPFGNKTINYRWAKKDGEVRYLYLHGNPIIWFSVVLGVVLAAVLVLGRYIFNLSVLDKRLFYLIAVFSAMYWAYMITMFNIERVMYLYHYFMPLFFGMFVLFLVFNYIFKESISKRSKLLYATVILFVIEIAYTYWFFSPLTYYKPLSTLEFIERQWFDFWKLKPVL